MWTSSQLGKRNGNGNGCCVLESVQLRLGIVRFTQTVLSNAYGFIKFIHSASIL